MRPNCPHTVLTTEHAICHGGHFYPTGAIRSSCFAFIHTFLAGCSLTNNSHVSESFLLFSKIMQFYHQSLYTEPGSTEDNFNIAANRHLPNVMTTDGIVDILSLYNLLELGNVLHPHTYTPDGIPSTDRHLLMQARALGRSLVSCLIQRVAWEGADLDLETFVWKYLAYQACAVWTFKGRWRGSNHAVESNGCTKSKILRAIEEVVGDEPSFWREWHQLKDENITSLAWTFTKKPQVIRRTTKAPGTTILP